MTKEEAIKKLKSFCHNCNKYPQCVNTDRECFEALEMAIQALENNYNSAEKEMKKAIKNCKYLSNNHYSIGGQKLHKGICSAKGSICSKIVYEGNCPVLIDLVKENEEEWKGDTE